MAIPNPAQFTAAPLRSRLRLELAASPSAVWELVGDLARLGAESRMGIQR